jgi:hypothetical protein
MHRVLFEYEMHPTTWVYLSSLLTIGIYFKFHRFFSVRNLDLIGLILFAPGLLLVARGYGPLGYVWLFAIGGFFLVRLIFDPAMVRRPLLEPNLNASGLTFTGACFLAFMIANVFAAELTESDREGARRWEQLLSRKVEDSKASADNQHGPGYPFFYAFADLPRRLLTSPDESDQAQQRLFLTATARVTAILGHFAIVIGLVLIGYRHFGNIQTGVAAATLYLILPYTTQMTARVDHVIPGAMVTWAAVFYRLPMLSGMFLALAAGAIYYPLFLLPLWCTFYWQRGLVRFLVGVLLTLAVIALSLVFTSDSLSSFIAQASHLVGSSEWTSDSRESFWAAFGLADYYRIPVVAAFLTLVAGLALWPPQKNLGTLLSGSAAVMLATQYWKAHEGGLYMAWYLPLLVLIIFRPNLEDRLALTTVSEKWGLAGLGARFSRLWTRNNA